MLLQSIIPAITLTRLIEVAWATPRGCFVEVGVYEGGSACRLYDTARQQGRDLYLFDTFEGIPYQDAIDHHAVGDFMVGEDVYRRLQKALPEAYIFKGIFPGTLCDFVTEIAFAHVDCDQYRAVSACIEHLWPRMVKGGVMWFDDPGVLAGARKAVLEYFFEKDLKPAPENRCYIVKG